MRKLLSVTVVSASLLALPALAATQGASSSGQSSSGQSSSSQSSMNTSEMVQSIRQDLTKAGYTDVTVAPGSFLVNAKDSRGNPTQMVISPHSVTAVTAMTPSGQSSGQSSGNTSQGGSSRN